jgi:hypothetical protein
MTNSPDTPDHDPSYPLGRFVRPEYYTAAARAAHVERIGTQPARLADALDGLDEQDFAAPYRPQGWTVGQLVHHMADSHANAYIRVKLGLTEHEPTIKPYDQDAWVGLADSRTLSPHVSVALFVATHIRLYAVLASMTPDQFARRVLHPENGWMSLDDVAAMYAWHGDHHIAHILNYRERYRAARP